MRVGSRTCGERSHPSRAKKRSWHWKLHHPGETLGVSLYLERKDRVALDPQTWRVEIRPQCFSAQPTLHYQHLKFPSNISCTTCPRYQHPKSSATENTDENHWFPDRHTLSWRGSDTRWNPNYLGLPCIPLTGWICPLNEEPLPQRVHDGSRRSHGLEQVYGLVCFNHC